jgi:hypothetical protein
LLLNFCSWHPDGQNIVSSGKYQNVLLASGSGAVCSGPCGASKHRFHSAMMESKSGGHRVRLLVQHDPSSATPLPGRRCDYPHQLVRFTANALVGDYKQTSDGYTYSLRW